MLGLLASRSKRRSIWLAGALVLILCASPARSLGQAAVEYGGAASHSAMAATAASKAALPSLPAPPPTSGSPSLAIPTGPPLDETNRKALEQRAGKDAGKLLLQSVPSQAQIEIDGNLVGRTPLLLIIPPGKYKVEMRGTRDETGERLVELLPNQTQQIAVTLTVQYPASTTAHPTAPSAFVAGTAPGGESLYGGVQQPAVESNSISLATPEGLSSRRDAKTRSHAGIPLPVQHISVRPRAASSSVAGTSAGVESSYPRAATPVLPPSADAQKLAATAESRYPSNISAHPAPPSSSNLAPVAGSQISLAPVNRSAEENTSSSPALAEPPPSAEAQKLALALEAQYPSNVSAHPAAAASFLQGTTEGVQPSSAPAQHAQADANTTLHAATEDPSGEANRKVLEQRAGRDAAKLLLQSVPSEALAYIDGRFVGRTPVELTVAPGKYKVEMNGEHEEVGERLVGVLPNEQQQVEITLASHYPASITIQ